MLTSAAVSVRVVEAEELSNYLGLEDSPEQDATLALILEAATASVEAHTGRAFISREFTEAVEVSGWQRRRALLRAPAVSVSTVSVDGDELDEDGYSMVGDVLVLDPFTYANTSLSVTYIAGYGAEAKDVPAALRLAVLRLAASCYENKENIVVGTIVADIPAHVADIARQYKRVFL